ncbi:MAG: hypothetical protein ACTSYA_01750 [Candidatus Kariarchaeaceae archaeon]
MSSSDIPKILPFIEAEKPLTENMIIIAITTKQMCDLMANKELEYQLPGQPKIVVHYVRD